MTDQKEQQLQDKTNSAKWLLEEAYKNWSSLTLEEAAGFNSDYLAAKAAYEQYTGEIVTI